MSVRKQERGILTVLAIALVIGAYLARPVTRLVSLVSAKELEQQAPAYVDDASRLNQTKVALVREIPLDGKDPEGQLTALLKGAQTQGMRVSVAGARHSMGGHTIYPGGLALNMLPWNRMELDAERIILQVQAGALWKDIIAYLDRRGRSVPVMQSNNSFSVGGPISVNCHGWQYGRPPIAATVASFRLMKADGTIARCSRTEQPELFSLVLGGYGPRAFFDLKRKYDPGELFQNQFYLKYGMRGV